MTRTILGFLAACLLPLQWFLVVGVGATHAASPPVIALAAGMGIFGAAFLLSWAAEAAQVDIPESLALAFLALIAVLPEYAVDMYFAWQAAHRPEYTAFATANMTGANRLLVGVGWAAVVLTFAIRSGIREIRLEPQHRIEIFFLLVATLYSFVIPWKGTITVWDSLFLIGTFVVYIVFASRAQHEEPELDGPAALLASFPKGRRRFFTIAVFTYAGLAILFAAEPFAESLIETGKAAGIEEFLLVQWLAPLASESPEFIVAILFAWRLKPGAAMGALISSKVNQWTLLIGMLPIVYSISAGEIRPMLLDSRQVEEILLTAAQSFFAVVVLADLRLRGTEASILFILFATQLFFVDPTSRYFYCAAYGVLSVGILAYRRQTRDAILRELPTVLHSRS